VHVLSSRNPLDLSETGITPISLQLLNLCRCIRHASLIDVHILPRDCRFINRVCKWIAAVEN